MTTAAEEKVIKIAQELLLDGEGTPQVTPSAIEEKIDMVLRMSPQWGIDLDRAAVVDELIRRFSIWIGQDVTLRNDEGHVDWLNADRRKDWRYWQRYREWLEGRLPWKAVDGLDQSTDTILGLLEDPTRQGAWDRRGLVVGHVQSGKTGSYTGLICKAADAGYKIIIVLAGMHNNLRAQTQIRLDEGFLGYATNPGQQEDCYVGVGRAGVDAGIRPNCATTRAEAGDFNTKVARHLAITPEQRPWLFVVKKNKTVLKRLLHWIESHVADTKDSSTHRKLVTKLPLLVIDDEADHASVDTGEQPFDTDGKPDEDYDPKAINGLIRRILHTFSRSAYVGYTATPFANIFIHERKETKEEGPDLFPAAFIINLAAPSDYVGPSSLLGRPDSGGRTGGLPLIRSVEDHESADGRAGWMPSRHKNGHTPLFQGRNELPPSLVEAIDAFIIVCAVRRARGQGADHSSMLVHVTRFNSVQESVFRQIQEYVRHLRQRLQRNIGTAELHVRLKEFWERDFVPTTERVAAADPLPAWQDVLDRLPDAVSDIEVRKINGTAKDALDYADRSATGLKVIAVGGDKLARGLTLEGLCVSYFLRASRMYDTLMQMGRWFGYRPGYLDLCRLYTTPDLVDWFGHIADASEELREEFDMMAASGATPNDYGLKVQSHPVLMVTSPLKMRSAKSLWLSFSGQLLETVAFHRSPAKLTENLNAAKRLVAGLSEPVVDPERVRNSGRQKWEGHLWEGVPFEKVVDFLSAYRTHSDAYKVNSQLLVEFIESMAKRGELVNWSVALIGGGEGGRLEMAPGVEVKMLRRSAKGSTDTRYSIGRLMSPRDETIDLDDAAWMAALESSRHAWHKDPGRQRSAEEPAEPNGPAIREIRGFGGEGVDPHHDRGLLLLYMLDPDKAGADFPRGTPPVVGFGISFPGSKAGVKVEYKANNILWEQEYGGAD
ncbi:MAG: Z1 domain-containing protein [Nitrospirae bacterium]|nr:Z1 domain-containing protein [Nitrospirota bacterium]